TLRWHGSVLPPGVGGTVPLRPGGQAGTVLADLPQRAGLDRVGDHARVEGVDLEADALGGGDRLALVLTGDLDEHPGRAAGQVRDGLRAAPPAHHVDDARVDALGRDGAQPLEPVGDVAG